MEMSADILKLARDCGFTAFGAKGAEFKLTRFFHEAQRLKVEEIRAGEPEAYRTKRGATYAGFGNALNGDVRLYRLPEANDKENKA
jgi:hypothetical protein